MNAGVDQKEILEATTPLERKELAQVPTDTVQTNKSNREEPPHKRSNSKITISPSNSRTKHAFGGSGLSFDPMARYKKKENREQHVNRRRRISLQSSCNAEGCDPVAAATAVAFGDIRSELQLEKDTTDLPDPKENISPEEYLKKLVKAMCGIEVEAKKARSLTDFFCKVSDDQIEAYTVTVVSAVRNNDLETLKKLHEEGQVLNCFNRFGESLLHMCCRRGFEDMVDYLLDHVDIRVCDDNGRTVLHDACWNPSPQLKICGRIMEREPTLFFICDNRGCSPFQYARPEHYEIWKQFLFDNRDFLKALKNEEAFLAS
mmetsp:Transcript_14749/g.26446  ORF Transcript_14749/g.26446 Transcript_14749/m.26446 type:complete len:317 (+) Transcript_14749:323-1273(+)|eukprot:CAMPEP_0178749250 /NCGR_PEP_ID=MMETSP0744-20121128/9309_1 /TAXON_ID=913974 /ORGANISM="Nitzschia punctata, Strain CCMP561" /LENGTH=316 /DNA_ID=CAMNT_0020402649 /DNA_START=344 /DNA_END=1294 /DNA_ORIENTATION=-